ncbi:MAG: bifunctional diaminohydroxyphosphoribosylaminopyrimidine deaminase/5-amino-6-(5-phosphoribosylamino)uracil reductase RibD [Sphingomonadales bacterium]|nr:bifunctional diaminohydroxyphosphoribosylaminopyrimidine deaminase/5-amino-6-(5-phosphoribosylamino)uracil reductase RibD [Sphingomonadales bacterium]
MTIKFNSNDKAFMEKALELARGQLGQVWPNPAVGCVLVKNGVIIAEGVTQKHGRPHGEQVALDKAGDDATGATAYVSLEPCAHVGKTPSCAKLLVEAGVKRVVYACGDPDVRTCGQGGDILRQAGIDVDAGLMEAEALELNQGFFLKVQQNRPMVSLKLATSNDGKIADPSSASQWVTGEAARDKGHEMRASHDAILVGVGTVLADDPMLDCRLAGLEHRSPVRIVLDSKWRTPLSSKLVQSAGNIPLWIVGLGQPPAELMVSGVKCLSLADKKDMGELLKLLAGEGITRLLVEGGAKVNASFATSGMVDHVAWFKAPHDIGAGGLGAIAGMEIEDFLKDADFNSINSEKIGKDTLVNFSRAG